MSWNAAEDLPPFLESVRAQDLPLELVVVDNGSSDGSPELVEQLWPTARLIRLPANVGFAAAAERGIAETSGDAVALLNYDLRLHPGYLRRCLEALAEDPALGSVQGLLLRPGQALVDSAGHAVTRGRWVRNRGENLLPTSGRWAPARTFGVTAAAAVYRRRMLDEVRDVTGHVFDEAFFAYLEDADLDWRARWLGWEAGVVDGAVAEHVRSGSGARLRPELQRHIIKNRLLLLYRNEDRGNLLRDLPWVAGQLLARWALALVRSPGSLAGIGDFLRLRRQQRPVRAAIKAARQVEPAAMREWFRGDGAGGLRSRTSGATPNEGLTR